MQPGATRRSQRTQSTYLIPPESELVQSSKFTRDFALTPFHLETSGRGREESSAAEALPSAPCYNGSSDRMLEQDDDERRAGARAAPLPPPDEEPDAGELPF